MNQTDEKILLEKIREGNYESFSQRYRAWVPQRYRFVYSLLKSEEAAQDIVQETFVKIWTNRKTLDTNSSFKAYLFTISYHLVLKEMKRVINHPLMGDYMEYCNNETMTTTSKVEEDLDFERFVEKLKQAKDKLTPRQRQIFEMNKEGNQTIAEIATLLSITEQSARNQLSAALKTIRKELGDYSFLLILFCSL